MNIPGVRLDDIDLHSDPRGRFTEIFRATDYAETFVQANHSLSLPGVLRGLHFHRRQADLWYVVGGRAQVGLVDLRERTHEPTTATIELDAAQPRALFIPEGVAHGYLALERVDLIYLVTAEYDASDEYGIAWNDPSLDIQWANPHPILSERDASNPPIRWEDIPSFS